MDTNTNPPIDTTGLITTDLYDCKNRAINVNISHSSIGVSKLGDIDFKPFSNVSEANEYIEFLKTCSHN